MKIIINEQEYSKFTRFFMQQTFDAFASSFSIYGESGTMPQEMLYAPIRIYDDDDNLMLTGNVINYFMSLEAKKDQVSIGGYSTPGILEDVNYPNEMYPIQMNLMSHAMVIKKVCDFFKIKYVLHENILDIVNREKLKTGISPTQSIKSFLAAIMSQDHVFITHDEYGVLHFLRPEKQNAIKVNENDDYVMGIDYRLNGQLLHNPITLRKQVGKMDVGYKTINNPLCKANRPRTVIMQNGFYKDMEEAAKNILSAELSSIKYYIKMSKYIKPGTLISLTSDTLNIHDRELFVENIRINIMGRIDNYSISCVPKEVYYDKYDYDIRS